jgi:hypothetical protein
VNQDPVWARHAQTRQHLVRLETAAALWALYREVGRPMDVRRIGVATHCCPMRLMAYLRATGLRSDLPRDDEPESWALLHYYRRLIDAAQEGLEQADVGREHQEAGAGGAPTPAGCSHRVSAGA